MIFKWSLTILSGLFTLVLPSYAQATSDDDWRILERLSIGTPISVVIQFRRECEFVKVTATELTCDREIGMRTRTLVFARAQIFEVRLERPDRNRKIAGALIGAGMGETILGLASQQASDPEARAYALVYGAPIGAFIGGAIGRHIHRHGSVIYRR